MFNLSQCWKQEIGNQDVDTERGRMRGRDNRESGMDGDTLLYVKWTNEAQGTLLKVMCSLDGRWSLGKNGYL